MMAAADSSAPCRTHGRKPLSFRPSPKFASLALSTAQTNGDMDSVPTCAERLPSQRPNLARSTILKTLDRALGIQLEIEIAQFFRCA